jgi:hypothetical protein
MAKKMRQHDVVDEQQEQTPYKQTVHNSLMSEKTQNVPGNLADRIKEMEQRVGIKTSKPQEFEGPANIYLDDYGRVTWFIKNDSGSHVVLGDLGLKIEKGSIANLLEDRKIEEIDQSSHVKRQLKFRNLIRLTPEQYMNELERLEESQRQINAMEMTQRSHNAGNPNQPKIQSIGKPRPLVDSQLNKLDLFYKFEEDTDPNKYIDPDKSKLQLMTPILFIKWLISEKFNEGEIDYMLGHPRIMRNPDIRAALLQKRKGIV